MEYCPKCHNPLESSTDDDRLCEQCGWWGGAGEVCLQSKVVTDTATNIRQLLALYRDSCRKELILESAYQQGHLARVEMIKARHCVAQSAESIIAMVVALSPQILPRVDGRVHWPAEWPKRGQCDMLVGPCACGKWHQETDADTVEALQQHNARIAN